MQYEEDETLSDKDLVKKIWDLRAAKETAGEKGDWDQYEMLEEQIEAFHEEADNRALSGY